MLALTDKIVITGAAGLVGMNLIRRLIARGHSDITGIDKHPTNSVTLQRLMPEINLVKADLAETGDWASHFKGARVLVLGQAQIVGLDLEEFERNNITATKNILDAARAAGVSFIVHISSSVVGSLADDFYTQTKAEQERDVRTSGLTHCVLRPTLMFGWFDRKHFGWLRRFLAKAPFFPVPGDGEYIRQPLFVGDFCEVIIACMHEQPSGEAFDISGLEHVSYIEIIRTIKRVTNESTPIIKIPFFVFWGLLWLVGKVWRTPPFTTGQLDALVIPETFPVFNWPGRFGITQTAFEEAVRVTFLDPNNAHIELDF